MIYFKNHKDGTTQTFSEVRDDDVIIEYYPDYGVTVNMSGSIYQLSTARGARKVTVTNGTVISEDYYDKRLHNNVYSFKEDEGVLCQLYVEGGKTHIRYMIDDTVVYDEDIGVWGIPRPILQNAYKLEISGHKFNDAGDLCEVIRYIYSTHPFQKLEKKKIRIGESPKSKNTVIKEYLEDGLLSGEITAEGVVTLTKESFCISTLTNRKELIWKTYVDDKMLDKGDLVILAGESILSVYTDYDDNEDSPNLVALSYSIINDKGFIKREVSL